MDNDADQHAPQATVAAGGEANDQTIGEQMRLFDLGAWLYLMSAVYVAIVASWGTIEAVMAYNARRRQVPPTAKRK